MTASRAPSRRRQPASRHAAAPGLATAALYLAAALGLAAAPAAPAAAQRPVQLMPGAPTAEPPRAPQGFAVEPLAPPPLAPSRAAPAMAAPAPSVEAAGRTLRPDELPPPDGAGQAPPSPDWSTRTSLPGPAAAAPVDPNEPVTGLFSPDPACGPDGLRLILAAERMELLEGRRTIMAARTSQAGTAVQLLVTVRQPELPRPPEGDLSPGDQFVFLREGDGLVIVGRMARGETIRPDPGTPVFRRCD
ncbi:MAG: hypothetical protein IT557_05615 [Alphaproteobacteria bacterium]|nr:hypothetical protein [Alphaproteobacteria bacterium]